MNSKHSRVMLIDPYSVGVQVVGLSISIQSEWKGWYIPCKGPIGIASVCHVEWSDCPGLCVPTMVCGPASRIGTKHNKLTRTHVHPNKKMRLAISWTIQSSPSTSPSPVTALQACNFQCRCWWVIWSNSNTCVICSMFKAPVQSCLLAKTSKVAPASRSSLSKACKASRQASSRRWSVLSTTHTNPSVASK